VPYNALLLQKYQCHVNVELCSSIKSVKYVYKYVYKGQTGMTLSYYLEVDGKRVTPLMTGPPTGSVPAGSVAVFDEIQEFVSGRSVCAHEAAWRLMGYNLQEQLQIRIPFVCTYLVNKPSTFPRRTNRLLWRKLWPVGAARRSQRSSV
jgi:hypothetical protein